MVLPLVLLLLAGPAHSAPAAQQTDPAIKVWLSDDRVDPGDWAHAKVRLNDDGYLLVLAADPSGQVRVLFPADPGADAFVRAGRTVDIRGRGRGSFLVGDVPGTGVVLAARTQQPLRFTEFVRGDHWDYGALDSAAQAAAPGDSANPDELLLGLAQQMAGGNQLAYDAASYTVNGDLASGGAAYRQPAYIDDGYGYGYGYYPYYAYPYWYGCYDPWFCGPGFYTGFTFGLFYSPFIYRPFVYRPFFGRTYFGRGYYGGPYIGRLYPRSYGPAYRNRNGGGRFTPGPSAGPYRGRAGAVGARSSGRVRYTPGYAPRVSRSSGGSGYARVSYGPRYIGSSTPRSSAPSYRGSRGFAPRGGGYAPRSAGYAPRSGGFAPRGGFSAPRGGGGSAPRGGGGGGRRGR